MYTIFIDTFLFLIIDSKIVKYGTSQRIPEIKNNTNESMLANENHPWLTVRCYLHWFISIVKY